jgi:hypothetical protein
MKKVFVFASLLASVTTNAWAVTLPPSPVARNDAYPRR